MDKVASIQAALASGTYNVPAAMIASKLVDSMLTLRKHLTAADSAREKEVIERQIKATDGEIDRLVYELYELTDEEIAIVESATA